MVWFVAGAGAAEPVIGASVRPEVWADVAGDRDLEDPAETALYGRLWGSGDLGPGGGRWFVEGRLQQHAYVQRTQAIGGELAPEGWYELGLGDTGLDLKVAGPVRIRAGALVARWGRMNLLPVADVLNPRDLRNGLRQHAAFQKLPLPMATLVVASEHVRSELSLIPFSAADRMWLRETDWSFVRQGAASDLVETAAGDGLVNPGWPLLDADGEPIELTSDEEAQVRSAIRNLGARIDDLSPSLRRGLDGAINQKGLPEALLVNGELAERLVLSGRNVEGAVMLGYVRSRQAQSALVPYVEDLLRNQTLPGDLFVGDTLDRQKALSAFQEQTATDNLIRVKWPRTALAGLDVTGLAGPLQLRGEALFESAAVVRQRYGASAATPSLGAAVGVDWFRGSSLQVSLESRYTRLLDPPKELLFALPDQVQVAGGVRWTTLRDRLVLQAGGSVDLSFVEGLFRPSVVWKAGDHVNVELGGLLLAGRTDPAEDLLDALVYRGGPISYFQQNDEVLLAVEFLK